MPVPNFPCQKGGTFSARGIHASRCPSASARPAVEALCRRLWSSPPSRRLLRNTIRRRGAIHGATAWRREKEQRRVLGRINADAAPHAGLGWARKPKPGLILRTNSQRGVSQGRVPPTSPRPWAGCVGFSGISEGFRRGFRRAPALPKNSRAGVSNLLKVHGQRSEFSAL